MFVQTWEKFNHTYLASPLFAKDIWEKVLKLYLYRNFNQTVYIFIIIKKLGIF